MEFHKRQKLTSGRAGNPGLQFSREQFPAGEMDTMSAVIYDCPFGWERLLPFGSRRLRTAKELTEHNWTLLALTPTGCLRLGDRKPVCRLLLAPGDCPKRLEGIQAETVITYGLSPRDSLTLSSLTEPLLCIQRTLPRLDGTTVDPQELPLPPLPAPAEELLPLLGLRLLQLPLTEELFPW